MSGDMLISLEDYLTLVIEGGVGECCDWKVPIPSVGNPVANRIVILWLMRDPPGSWPERVTMHAPTCLIVSCRRLYSFSFVCFPPKFVCKCFWLIYSLYHLLILFLS